MAYEGWFSYGGTEIINAQRTAAYVKAMLPNATVHDICGGECSCDHLHAFLGDNPYASPLADDAPWTDPDRIESYEFLGLYPLDVTNLTDGTTVAQIVEGLGDGGWISSRRARPREVLFSVAMFSTTEAGDDYGQAWLKAALDGSCEDETCTTSTQLCFLSSCADPEEFTGRVVKTEHPLSDWKLYHAGWRKRTIDLRAQDSYAEVGVPGSCGEVEWELQVRGQAGNHFAVRHTDREDEIFLLDGGVQEFRITSTNTKLRLGIPDVTGMASWRSPDTEAEHDAATLLGWAESADGGSLNAAGGQQAAWDNFTAIPLPLEIVRLVSNARYSNTDDECAKEFMRYLRRVGHTDGPRTRSVQRTRDGGIIRTLEFVLTAETPAIYGEPVLAAKGSSSKIVAMAVPYRTQRLQTNIGDCVPVPIKQVLDPQGPVIPPPPVPSLTQADERPDADIPPSKNPYAVMIPASTIPQWLNAVPVVNITAGKKAVRKARVRFFPIPLDSYLPTDIDPCSACGSFQIDYLPAGATFTFDAADHRATVTTGGLVQSGEHLLTGDQGRGGVTWPMLSCGIPYMVVIDSREQALSDVEIFMVERS